MAKGQISEQELETGLRAIGGLTGIALSGARRDSPFRTDPIKKPQPVMAPITQAPVAATELNEAPQGDESIPPTPSETRFPGPKAPRLSRKAVPSRNDDEKLNPMGAAEKVTVLMPPEMRDDVKYLATKLQRRKVDKRERITANTVMRAAIQFLLDELKLRDTDVANTEEEFLELMKRKILRDSRSSTS